MTPVRGQTVATLDPPLNVLREQILAATTLEFAEIGWIAGAGHAQSGGHFPENPAPPGNPPGEVDAIDPPHKPSAGADMAVLTEALRLSRDPRIKFVIFNRRIFSSYAHAEGLPFTWRPYRESDPHTGHAHIERTDQLRSDLRPWSIGIDGKAGTVFLAAFKVGDKGAHVQFVQYALYDLHEATRDADTKPLYPGPATSPTLPSSFTTADGQAMRRLLDGGDGINFTPLLAKRLMRKLGALDITTTEPPEPVDGVTAAEAKLIAENVLRHASISPAQEATPR